MKRIQSDMITKINHKNEHRYQSESEHDPVQSERLTGINLTEVIQEQWQNKCNHTKSIPVFYNATFF